MSRDIIIIGGKPGSGKSRLGRDVATRLAPEVSVEHLSLGERVRAIGRGALSSYSREVMTHLNSPYPELPLRDEVAYDLVSEYLSQAETTDLILLDGYPRYLTQVESVYELAMKDERRLRGMIITDVNDETALMRMLKRNKKDDGRQETDPLLAQWRIQNHQATFQPVYDELEQRELPIETIDTSYEKQATTRHGLFAVAYILSLNETSGAN